MNDTVNNTPAAVESATDATSNTAADMARTQMVNYIKSLPKEKQLQVANDLELLINEIRTEETNG